MSKAYLVTVETTSSFFFHYPDFIYRNGENIISFSAGKKNNISICFNQRESTLISLDRSPFGGFIFGQSVARSEITDLIQSIVERATAESVTSIVIKCFPDIYDTYQSTLIEELLCATGFSVKYKDITQVMHIRPGKLLPMNTHRQRRLRTCIRHGFIFRSLSVDELPQAYSLFTESRESKGYPVTMSLAELATTIERFPDRYILSGVFDGDKMVASAVCIVVNSAIMYCFYIGDALAYRRYSPVTLLVSGIYESCVAGNFSLLDLGISTHRGVLNKGLYDFKKSLGCDDSFKLTFERRI